MDSLITTLRQRAAGMASAPVDEPSISRAERALGRALPVLLRDVYRHVGNGGFGPGYGLLPLLPERDAFPDESLVGLYQTFLSDDSRDVSWSWPEQLLPFCDWGGAIRACVDCSTEDAAVVTFDPNVRGPGEPTASALAVTHASLHGWLADWAAGVDIWEQMFEPDPSRTRTGVDPITKKPFSVVPRKLRRRWLSP
jgi:hypothetical protein